MKFVDQIQFREFSDELPAALAVQGFDCEILGEVAQKFGEWPPVQRYFTEPRGWIDFWGWAARDDEVDVSAGLFEDRVLWIELSGV